MIIALCIVHRNSGAGMYQPSMVIAPRGRNKEARAVAQPEGRSEGLG